MKAKQPEALRLARLLDIHMAIGGGDLEELAQAAAELRRLHLLNAELLEALRDLSASAPKAPNCADFHHGYSARHGFGEECRPVADYAAALAKAQAAIALATQA